MASNAPGAMDSLKSKIPKRGRKNRGQNNTNQPPSRVQQFYEEFNSSQSASTEDSDSSDNGTFFGYKNRPKAPMIRPVSATQPISPEFISTPSDSGSINSSNKGTFSFPEPLSPGLSKNQDIKDSALNVIFQKRIKELKSILTNFVRY